MRKHILTVEAHTRSGLTELASIMGRIGRVRGVASINADDAQLLGEEMPTPTPLAAAPEAAPPEPAAAPDADAGKSRARTA